MPKSTIAPTKLIFFSFGILEQGGGFEYYLISTASGLRRRFKDLDISIVTMTPEIVEKLQHILTIYFMSKQDTKAIYRETYESVIKKLGDARYVQASSLKELASLLKEADVIYSKNEVIELTVLNKIGLKKLPPIILGVHTPIYYPNTPSLSARLHNFLYTGRLYKKFIKHVNRIQANNSDDVALIKEKLGFSKVKLMRQAFDIPPLAQKRTKKGELHLLFVGRLTQAKGLGLLTQIIKLLEKDPRIGKFTFTIVGSGDRVIVSEVEALAKQSPSVLYRGQVPNEQIMQLYDETDITIITSQYETLNKVAVETAIAGKIAVCTDIPGPREVIRHQKTGFLLPPNAEAFVDCIAKLKQLKKEDPRSYEQIGQEAYNYVKQKYDSDEVYKELYDDILAATQEGTA